MLWLWGEKVRARGEAEEGLGLEKGKKRLMGPETGKEA